MNASVSSGGEFRVTYKSPYDKPLGTYTWWAVDGLTGEACVALKYEITQGTQPPEAATPVQQSQKPVTIQASSRAENGEISVYEPFDPDKPTTVIVHGWNREGKDELPEWVINMKNWLTEDEGRRSNVITYNWLEDAATPDPPATDMMTQHGVRLAGRLANYFWEQGGYEGKIHFIGHSAGAGVSYQAVNTLVSDHEIPVNLLTILDAYQFNGDKALRTLKAFKNPWNLLNPVSKKAIIATAIVQAFKITSPTKADFLENYWSGVGALGHVFAWGATFSSIYKGTHALIATRKLELPSDIFTFTDEVTDTSFFVESKPYDELFHKPAVNWYMASMVDHLEIARYTPSGKNDDHQYGFYWSPIFPDHERPNKADTEFFIGLENYFDLITSSQVVANASLIFKQEVEALVAQGEQLSDRLENSASELQKDITITAADVLTDTASWVASNSSNVYHNTLENSGYFWLQSGSPVSVSRDYLIPEDGGFMGFSYKVLQADGRDSYRCFHQ